MNIIDWCNSNGNLISVTLSMTTIFLSISALGISVFNSIRQNRIDLFKERFSLYNDFVSYFNFIHDYLEFGNAGESSEDMYIREQHGPKQEGIKKIVKEYFEYNKLNEMKKNIVIFENRASLIFKHFDKKPINEYLEYLDSDFIELVENGFDNYDIMIFCEKLNEAKNAVESLKKYIKII